MSHEERIKRLELCIQLLKGPLADAYVCQCDVNSGKKPRIQLNEKSFRQVFSGQTCKRIILSGKYDEIQIELEGVLVFALSHQDESEVVTTETVTCPEE